MNLFAIIGFVKDNWEHIALVVTGLITAASVIVKFTPGEFDNEALNKVISVCKVIGLYPKDK